MNRKKLQEFERWFDGELETGAPVESPSAANAPECTEWRRALERMREGASAVARREQIADSQFPAFMAGIREGIEAPPAFNRGRLWALLSLTAAALIVAVSTFAMFSGGPVPADAKTEFESVSTDLEHYDLRLYDASEGAPTLWITPVQEDIL